MVIAKVWRVGLIGVVALSSSAIAGGLVCKTSPIVSGKCVVRHGTLNISADAAEVLWLDKSAGTIVIRAADGSSGDMPANLSKILARDFQAEIIGDFEACPIPQQAFPAGSRFGCINAASHIVVRSSRIN